MTHKLEALHLEAICEAVCGENGGGGGSCMCVSVPYRGAPSLASSSQKR